MDGDYPKDISEGFTGIPDNIDTVTVWTGNGKIYFYKGTKFWRFDPTQKPPVKNTYPKLISNWESVPDNLDASIVYRGYTYFFKGNAYYRFNDRTFSVSLLYPFAALYCVFPNETVVKMWKIIHSMFKNNFFARGRGSCGILVQGAE